MLCRTYIELYQDIKKLAKDLTLKLGIFKNPFYLCDEIFTLNIEMYINTFTFLPANNAVARDCADDVFSGIFPVNSSTPPPP
jgi:hypothetical protein